MPKQTNLSVRIHAGNVATVPQTARGLSTIHWKRYHLYATDNELMKSLNTETNSPLVEEPLAHAVHLAVVDEVWHPVEGTEVPTRGVSRWQSNTQSTHRLFERLFIGSPVSTEYRNKKTENE